MAVRGSDGSIILTTKVDTSGISKGSVSIKSTLQNVDATVKKVQNSFAAFREQKVTLATLTQGIKDQQYVLNALNLEYAEYVAKGKASSAEAKKLKNNIDELTAEMKEMQAAAATLGARGSASINKIGVAMKSLLSYFIGIQTIFKVINFSGEAAEFATQTEASVQRLIDIYGEASKSVGTFIDTTARSLGMSKSSGASIAATYGNLLSVWADQETNAKLTTSLLTQTAVVASKTGRTTTDVAERIRSGLLGNTEAIEDLGINVNIKTIEITDAFKRIADGRSWEQLNAYEQAQVRTLAILEQSINKYGTTVAETSATIRNQYQAAYEDFKSTWGQVVNKVLIPVLKVLTQVFTIATKGLQIIAGLSGKTIDSDKSFENQKASIGGAVKNQEALTDAVKGTNKELKKSLAGFDDINILSQDTAENSGGAGTSGADGGVGGIGNLGGTSGDSPYVEEISSTLMAIMGIVGIALVAVGLILLFTGHIGWGIGFIIAGAGTLMVTMAAASAFDMDGIINMLTTIMSIAGGALLALGIILLWLGGVVGKGVAIGMIIAGAALIVGAVAAKAAFAPNDVKGWLTLIMGIAAGALLALGIILCMVGSTPLGVGMIIAGSVALVSAVALNFNAVTDQITGWVAVIMAIAGAALLVLGIILTCSGNFILGIPLIAAGAVALVTPIALNWDTIKKKTIEVFTAIGDWMKTWGLLVLGIILCVTGVALPLGIALIQKGAANLTEAQDPMWTAIVDKVKEIWDKIKQFWNTYIAPVFTAKWWADLGKKALNGFIGVVEKGLNFLIDKVNVFIGGIGKAISAVGGLFGANWSVPKIPNIKIPRLAQGAVIPPNREFLAVLGDQKRGTNIEAPAELIKQMAMEALLEVGMTGQTTKEEHYYLNETELMSIIYKLVKGGERLKGNSLISGGAY